MIAKKLDIMVGEDHDTNEAVFVIEGKEYRKPIPEGMSFADFTEDFFSRVKSLPYVESTKRYAIPPQIN